MTLQFRYNKETYHPDNRLDMYDLVTKLEKSQVKLQCVTEEYKRLYKRYLEMLEQEKEKVRKRDKLGRFI